MLAISQGDGLDEIFRELMVDKVIKGGQTMNPSASDIADAVARINAENVFVFPNNSNIILAAEQAKGLVEGKKIYVVPTKNVPQGFAAALAFNPDLSADENLINMLHEIENVATGQVTYAVRTTKIDGFSLKKGDFIGLNSKKVLAKATSVEEAAIKLIDKYIEVYKEEETQSDWFNTLKTICDVASYCADTKEYRQNPDNYKGSVADVSTLIRLCITGRKNSPDLFSIMLLIGKEESLARIESAIALFKENL